MAYASDEAGVREIWVRAFPEGEPAFRITTRGGASPAWAPDGKELFFRRRGEAGSEIWGVDVTTESQFSRDSEPRLLHSGGYGATTPIRNYDVAPDGGFLAVTRSDERAEAQPVTSLNVVLNWIEELKERVPTGR